MCVFFLLSIDIGQAGKKNGHRDLDLRIDVRVDTNLVKIFWKTIRIRNFWNNWKPRKIKNIASNNIQFSQQYIFLTMYLTHLKKRTNFFLEKIIWLKVEESSLNKHK